MRFESGSLLGEINYWLYWKPVYPRLMRLAHRHGWHHVKTIGPLMPGGGYLKKCNWCGLCDISEAKLDVVISQPSQWTVNSDETASGQTLQ